MDRAQTWPAALSRSERERVSHRERRARARDSGEPSHIRELGSEGVPYLNRVVYPLLSALIRRPIFYLRVA